MAINSEYASDTIYSVLWVLQAEMIYHLCYRYNNCSMLTQDLHVADRHCIPFGRCVIVILFKRKTFDTSCRYTTSLRSALQKDLRNAKQIITAIASTWHYWKISDWALDETEIQASLTLILIKTCMFTLPKVIKRLPITCLNNMYRYIWNGFGKRDMQILYCSVYKVILIFNECKLLWRKPASLPE